MKFFVPARLPKRPALAVVLHGCLQSPESLNAASGFSKLARDRGFVLLYPQQRRTNNAQNCFNWYRPSAVAKDRGEVMSIRQMIEYACERHRIDVSRIFIVGLSAGGAMVSALVANYPEIFAGAAIVAGMPFGSARDAVSALRAMKGGAAPPPDGWGRPIAQIHNGPRPSPPITIWQGANDRVVNPLNARACFNQWLQAKGISEYSGRTAERSWGSLTSWTVAGEQKVALYFVNDLGHGLPVKKRGGQAARRADPYVISTGISAPAELIRLWRLAGL
ncbi:extracellular catalytic domain type 1 short-chain-length polyhydroxyalkanoate depolymerase [Rhizobium sp. CB3060]|uniref:extracellular catalytic domain type 1 short-chain-length polyhydroxyalkanoate depolymerase n=1 Tax=Rhizobium sp. CB3060 TaxID=3138255 RepID=UPI00288A2469|nr:PHB depolymerase family esterase [Rhizobium tropici]